MEGGETAESILFGSFRLERAGLFRLDGARSAELVALGSRAFDLLMLLTHRAGEVVGKDEIMAAVWPGATVEDSNLTVQISALRRILDAGRTGNSCIQSVRGRGYRFTAQIAHKSAFSAPTLPLAATPSIAVLPFEILCGDSLEFFVESLAEEIVTALIRTPGLVVVARHLSSAYGKQAAAVTEARRQLGVRYVLEGSARKAGKRARIIARLLEVDAGIYLWADRFEAMLEDGFDFQDRLATRIARLIVHTVRAVEMRCSTVRPTIESTAHDLYLRGHGLYLSGARQVAEALYLLEQAIARDPTYGPGLAWAAIACFRLISDSRSNTPVSDRLKGIEFARRALELAGDDPAVLANSAQALTFFGEDSCAMLSFVERALTLNPNFARGWFSSSAIRLWTGDTEIAIEHANMALGLSPHVRVAPSLGLVGMAQFLSRRFDEAVPTLRLPIEEDPSYPQPYRYLAACYAHMGRLSDAADVVSRLRAAAPVVTPDPNYLRKPAHRELYLSGVRLAIGAEREGPHSKYPNAVAG